MVKWRSEGDMQCDVWYWHRVRSNPPLGCLWRHWRSTSTLMQRFCPGGNVFCWCCIQYRIIPYQYPIMGWCIQPSNDFFAKRLACGFGLPPSDTVLLKGKTVLHSDTMWYDRKYVARHIGEIGILWVCFLLLVPPVGNIGQPECTANLNGVGVVVITIRINLPPVLWRYRSCIQIKPCGC